MGECVCSSTGVREMGMEVFFPCMMMTRVSIFSPLLLDVEALRIYPKRERVARR